MTPQEYIKQERAKGTSEIKIREGVRKIIELNNPTPPQERSFVQEILPTSAAVAGGIGGGILGIPGGPVGIAAGSAAGATLLGTAGEALQQEIEKIGGQRTQSDVPQAVATGISSGVWDLAGGVAGQGLKLAGKVVNKPLVKFLSKMSNFSDDLIEKALERSSTAVQGAKEGEQYLSRIVKDSVESVHNFAMKSVAEAKKTVTELNQKLLDSTPNLSQIASTGRKYMDNVIHRLETEYRITNPMVVSPKGGVSQQLQFGTSPITNPGEQKTIRDAFQTLGLLKNPTIENIDSAIERLISLKSKTSAGSGAPTGPTTKKIIQEMLDEITETVRVWGKDNPAYAEYFGYLEKNLEKRVLLDDLREIFGGTAHPSPKELSQIEKRLINMYGLGGKPIKEMVEGQAGVLPDVSGATAGVLIKETGKKEVAGNVMGSPQTAKTNILNILPNQVVRNYLKTGNIVGLTEEFSKKLGITSQAAGQIIINLLMDKTTNVDETAGNQPPLL